MIQDLAFLLWVVNLGCIDLNQWCASCPDVDRPDYLHFDLDPGPGMTFNQVLETAAAVREDLSQLKIPSYPKTSGSRGIHIYVPIRSGPTQKQVWGFAKELARRPASVYSVRPRPLATVSPLGWDEIARGRVRLEQFL